MGSNYEKLQTIFWLKLHDEPSKKTERMNQGNKGWPKQKSNVSSEKTFGLIQLSPLQIHISPKSW